MTLGTDSNNNCGGKRRRWRIGVDIGGTNTDADADVMREDTILAGVKSPTTRDVMGGVVDSTERALRKDEEYL